MRFIPLSRVTSGGQILKSCFFFLQFLPISPHKTSYFFQLLQISNAMRPEDGSCTDKVKEIYPGSKF